MHFAYDGLIEGKMEYFDKSNFESEGFIMRNDLLFFSKPSSPITVPQLKVMAFVQKAVARLYEPDKLETLLRDLGKKHYHYGAKQKYVDLIGPQFIMAIQPSLVDRWTEEMHSAWTALFLNMAYIMKGSMAAEERFKKSHDIFFL
ncbi:neuroglobin-like [Aphis craccivora]|uniref:Neuroglobin-like n=1 Tax=Aphis craccivora TaxID=307492 RepID=A0A6G0Z6J4_APHCR|nr:neuroglobin-like [Aphis craccivora]